MSKLLRLQPGVSIILRRFKSAKSKLPITFENKAYPWEGVKIEKIDYSGKYGRVPNTPSMLRLMEEMTHMCKDDGLHVWQKNGWSDDLWYWVIMSGVVLVLGYTAAIFYTIENPPCPKRSFPPEYYRPEEQDDGKVWHPFGCCCDVHLGIKKPSAS